MVSKKIHIKTIQPYFVFETEKFYQHIMASYGISHFFSYKIPKDAESNILFVPDGCSSLIFSYGESDMKASVFGSMAKRETFPMEPNHEYFGIRFQPGENPCFADISVKELVNTVANFRDFPRMKLLCNRMEQSSDFEERIKIFLDFYTQYLYSVRKKNQHNLFCQMCFPIAKANGVLKISELAQLTGYSARYINFLFTEELGIDAKRLCRIAKFQTMINLMNRGDVKSLSKLAADFRYFDQSHFIHDFRSFTNETPSGYLKRVRMTKYCSKVVDL